MFPVLKIKLNNWIG
uniref:Uncharacterized protein n=1 Tax=Arundo donax TaxID=35708 RepID=A0A0A9FEP3_ARUDO